MTSGYWITSFPDPWKDTIIVKQTHLRNLGEDLKRRAHSPQTVLREKFPC